MRINDQISITKRSVDDALLFQNLNESTDTRIINMIDDEYPTFRAFYDEMRNTPYDSRPDAFQAIIADAGSRFAEIFKTAIIPDVVPAISSNSKEKLVNGIQKLMDFFTEFGFVPSFRFTNTFAFKASESAAAARVYTCNYFALMDSSYAKDVVEKTKSPEFSEIVRAFAQYGKPSNTINTRFKVYFGSAGTGKTTIAQEESENRCIVCNSSMLPSDLMEDFIFKDGNPDFNPSLLWDCMEQGKTIVLDEINLLPFDSLRFLQGIVDGKKEFYYKNRPVHINDGFQIIGTMNLSLSGMIYGLPEPLVDRCSDAREFTLTAEQLAKSVIGMDGE